MDMLAVTMGANFHIIKFKKATTWLVMCRNEVFNFGYNIIFVFFTWPPARDFFLSVFCEVPSYTCRQGLQGKQAALRL